MYQVGDVVGGFWYIGTRTQILESKNKDFLARIKKSKIFLEARKDPASLGFGIIVNFRTQ